MSSNRQGRRTASCAALCAEGWEHTDLENRFFGSFRFCRSTFDMLRVHHHTSKDVQSAQADQDLESEPKFI